MKEMRFLARDLDSLRKRGLGAFAYEVPLKEVTDEIKTQVTADHLRMLADYLDGSIPAKELVLKYNGNGDWINIQMLGQALGVII